MSVLTKLYRPAIARLLRALGPVVALYAYDPDHDARRRSARLARVFVASFRSAAYRALRLELYLLPAVASDLGRTFGAGLVVGGTTSDHPLVAHLDLGFVKVHLASEGFGPRRRGRGDRALSLAWYARALHWSLWSSPDEWRASTPRWRQGTWSPADALLGRERMVAEERVSAERVFVPMLEGAYLATVIITRRVYARRRWLRRERVAASIECERGIPVPSRGGDEDAIYGVGANEPTAEAAVASMVRAALAHRRRYGGVGWIPEADRGAPLVLAAGAVEVDDRAAGADGAGMTAEQEVAIARLKRKLERRRP